MQRTSALIAGAFFTSAGVSHFARPDFFESIVPDRCPDARLANQANSAAELAFGLGMFHPSTPKVSALGLAALTVGVFPANIDLAVNAVEPKLVDCTFTRSVGRAKGPVNWFRLPLQLPLLWWLWREHRAA